MMLFCPQRALEASRQDMERAGRKRKRDKLLAAREEQSAKYEDMQKRVEKTMEVVNMARNLDGNSVLALTVCSVHCSHCAINIVTSFRPGSALVPVPVVRWCVMTLHRSYPVHNPLQ